MTTPISAESAPQSIAERYEPRELLGQGGMARVYRVFDRARGCEVALKQLTADPGSQERRTVAALFEREFQTLAQLRHPSVISVYDYALPADAGPYYTMELLDGGDLLANVPMSWRQACSVMFDICSSLALLHSRKLLHRDISPRNVRCTGDNRAKLIDFGAMGPMTAGGAQVVGTPAFSAPETLHRLALDARTDLYSLGATFYYALTGALPYSGRTFADMLVAWTGKVVPPSVLTKDVPPALDDLVLSLVHPEPELRPASAYEVMQRLAAIAGMPASESDTVSQAYLTTPVLAGRSDEIEELRRMLMRARLTRSGGMIIQGPPGIGRSRLLDACALEAKALGFQVLRAGATASTDVFGVARALLSHLVQARPSLANSASANKLLEPRVGAQAPAVRQLTDVALDPSQLQRVFCELFVSASRAQPLLLAVDDVHRIDSPSAAVLAALLDTRRTQLFIALTSDSGAAPSDALAALARRSGKLSVEPLSHEQTHQLLGSLFGDTPNLAMLSREIYKVAQGNPRHCMELAQHLLDRGVVRYESGTWILPSRLDAQDLPRDVAATMQARVDRLSPPARRLAEAHALAFFESWRDQDYHSVLPGLGSAQVEQAVSELLAEQVIIRDGQHYTVTNRVWMAALTHSLSDQELRERHQALVQLYEGRSTVAQVHHAFCAGMDELGLDLLVARHDEYNVRLDYQQLVEHNVVKMIWAYEPAIATALSLGRSRRQVNELRRWQLAATITQQYAGYPATAQLWLEQLEHDSGLSLYREAAHLAPTERLTHALQTAYQRYVATPEADRVYAVDEAIRLLAEYVVYCIALGGRAQDATLLRGIPDLLEPFAALSPVLHAIWENALATRALVCDVDLESARARWQGVLAKLDALAGDELQHIEPIRNAVVYGLAVIDVQLGLPADALAARLDYDPYQSVAALTLRKIERLERGDWRGAELFRRKAEVLALELRWPEMFKSSLLAEVWTYARAGDLAGMQLVIEQERTLCRYFPGWVPCLLQAEGCFHQARGDLEAALLKFRECIALTMPDETGQSLSLGMWLASHVGLSEVQLDLEQFEQAYATAEIAQQECDARGLRSHAFELHRVLALAEGKLGRAAAGATRLETVIERQLELGSTGLRLGLSYEARARLALWSDDPEGFERYAALTAREYRHGARSPLGARYERLLNEAKRRGVHTGVRLQDIQTSSIVSSDALATQDLLTVVSRSMAGKLKTEQRAETALSLLCAARNASVGHLYLSQPDGLRLFASRGVTADDAALADAAGELLQAEQLRSDDLAEMVTGELDEGEMHAYCDSGGQRFELLLLNCVVNAVTTPVGVAAVAVANDVPMDSARQGQLLNVLASHLLHDVTAVA